MNNHHLTRLSWRCPRCGASMIVEMKQINCSQCYAVFPIDTGRVDFINNGIKHSRKDLFFDIKLRNFYKQWPRLYYFIASAFGPAMFSGVSASKFVKKFDTHKSVGLNLGSGPKIIRRSIVNVDMDAYNEVDIRADVLNVPLQDASVDFIVCDELVEHVQDTQKLIAEVHRMLKPGGYAYFTVLFLYPYHASPVDFVRWTRTGFASLVGDFSIIESGIRAGAFSALTAYICYLFALIFSFNSKTLFWILMNISIFIFWPLKLLDILFYRFETADNLASVFYFIVKKK